MGSGENQKSRRGNKVNKSNDQIDQKDAHKTIGDFLTYATDYQKDNPGESVPVTAEAFEKLRLAEMRLTAVELESLGRFEGRLGDWVDAMAYEADGIFYQFSQGKKFGGTVFDIEGYGKYTAGDINYYMVGFYTAHLNNSPLMMNRYVAIWNTHDMVKAGLKLNFKDANYQLNQVGNGKFWAQDGNDFYNANRGRINDYDTAN